MSKLQQALDLVATMSATEKKELLSHLALANQSSKKQSSGSNRDHELWLGEVVDALGRVLMSGGRSPSSLALFKRLQGDCGSTLDTFMEQSGLGKLKIPERVATYRILADMLVKHAEYVARKSGAPLSPKLVMNCVGNLPGLFDSAFPGYLEAGLAPVIIRRKLRG